MKTCTFFGHRDAREEIKTALQQAIIALIEKEGVLRFYVGAQGRFDGMVRTILKELAEQYPIHYEVVLAYPPEPGRHECPDGFPTLLPEGQEKGPLRFAIDRRNRWMIQNSDFVISYTFKTYGGAVKFTELAQRHGLSVISL